MRWACLRTARLGLFRIHVIARPCSTSCESALFGRHQHDVMSCQPAGIRVGLLGRLAEEVTQDVCDVLGKYSISWEDPWESCHCVALDIKDVKKELRSRWSAVVLPKDHNIFSHDKKSHTQTTWTQHERRQFGNHGTTFSPYQNVSSVSATVSLHPLQEGLINSLIHALWQDKAVSSSSCDITKCWFPELCDLLFALFLLAEKSEISVKQSRNRTSSEVTAAFFWTRRGKNVGGTNR